MSHIRRKGRFVSRDVDKRKTIFSDNFGGVGKKNNVREQGRCACVNGATCGDFSTSLSARSSNTDQETDESTLSDAQDDGDDGVRLDNLFR